MSGDVERRVEELLKTEVAGARRDPPRGMHARIAAAIESGAAGKSRGPISGSTWRGRVQDGLVAASVLIAASLWLLALLRLSPHDPSSLSVQNQPSADVAAFTWKDAFDAVQGSASPRRLSVAIDSSLFSELDNISHDALRAARFLAGRVPAPLVEGDLSSSPR